MSATLVGAVRGAEGEVAAGVVTVVCSTFLGRAPATARTATTTPTARAPSSTKKKLEIRMEPMLGSESQSSLRRGSAGAKTRLHPPAPARPRDARAEARRRRHRRADLRDPLVQRLLAGDQAVERVGDRRLDVGARERVGEERHEVERLDRLTDAAGDLRRRDALREQLAGLAVAALGSERGAHEVAGAG